MPDEPREVEETLLGPAMQRILNALHTPAIGPGPEGSYLTHCPSHGDRNPSLTLKEISGGMVINCHAGCTPSEVMAGLGLTLADMFNKTKKNQN